MKPRYSVFTFHSRGEVVEQHVVGGVHVLVLHPDDLEDLLHKVQFGANVLLRLPCEMLSLE